MKAPRDVRLWTTLVLAYACAIFIGSSIPQPYLPPIVTSISDKVLHIAEYGVFGFLLHRALRVQSRRPLLARHATLLAIAFAVGYGATDEFHQLFVPGRTCDVFDWLADSIGAVSGAALSTWIVSRRTA